MSKRSLTRSRRENRHRPIQAIDLAQLLIRQYRSRHENDATIQVADGVLTRLSDPKSVSPIAAAASRKNAGDRTANEIARAKALLHKLKGAIYQDAGNTSEAAAEFSLAAAIREGSQ